MPSLYQEDLAWVHDDGFDDLAESAARMVLDLVEPVGRAVDLGCGSGILLARLAAAGFDPWGLDLSPDMVGLARRRLPDAHIQVGDATAAPLPSCRVVTAIGEVLAYAMAPGADGRWTECLRTIRTALGPEGVLLFDLPTPGRAADGPTHASRKGRGWRVEATAREDDGRLVRTIDTWRTLRGQPERHTREVHVLVLRDPEQVLGDLEAAGFEARRLGGYDDHGFVTGWDGFLARAI